MLSFEIQLCLLLAVNKVDAAVLRIRGRLSPALEGMQA